MKDEMKSTYTVKDLQSLLNISKNTAYKLVVSGAFPVLKIGRTYRIPREGFHKWMDL